MTDQQREILGIIDDIEDKRKFRDPSGAFIMSIYARISIFNRADFNENLDALERDGLVRKEETLNGFNYYNLHVSKEKLPATKCLD